MSKRIKITIVILFVIFALGITAWIVMRNTTSVNPTAEIYSGGELIRKLPLNVATEIVVTCADGMNRISVMDGRISVIEADCPDKVCVKTGAISGGGVPIICLPHRLEIRIVSDESGIDGQIR